MRTVLLLFVLLQGFPAYAASIKYSFTYTYSNTEPGQSQPPVISGALFGTLQQDGDTILVDSLEAVSLANCYSCPPGSSIPLPLGPEFSSTTSVSLSGEIMNIGYGVSNYNPTFPSQSYFNVWGLNVGGDGLAGIHTPSAFVVENYDPLRWQIDADVPLPAAAWLFLSAIGGLGVLNRIRKS